MHSPAHPRADPARPTDVPHFAVLPATQLPEPEADEFYLADLIGLIAVDGDGATLGRVCAVHDYGAGASLEIEGAKPLIVPFTQVCVPQVDVAGGRVTVVAPEGVDVALPPPAGAPGCGPNSVRGSSPQGEGEYCT